MGQKPYIKTKDSAALVASLAMVGLRDSEIAKVMTCAEATVKRHYREELKKGRVLCNAQVVTNLYRMTSKSPAAAMFWLKCRAGWREQDPVIPGEKPERPLYIELAPGQKPPADE